ncbi:MAG TPA: hypothetical protein VLW75_11925 [Rhizomicrobium sp.]|nr:hypothetical protein [Rhizomicrobium sp.]
MRSAVYAAFFALVCARAEAATPLELYQQGKYDAAISAGIAQNDAAGFAVAARAELAAEMMRSAPCLACLRRAEDDARKAIAADPNLPEGHIYLAVTLGYEARVVGIVTAGARGYASEAKKELDIALASDPANYWALAALGGWNVEIVRNGGASLANWIYGASIDDAMTRFHKAFALASGNLVLRYQYALSLAGYDLARYRSEVEASLARAQMDKPRTAYESFAQGRAKELLDALKKNDLDAFDDLVRRDQGYP